MGTGPLSTVGGSSGPVRSPIRFLPLAVAWTVVILIVTVVLALGNPTSTSSIMLGNGGILAALIFAVAACLRAARLGTRARHGWAWMTVAAGMATVGQLIFMYSTLTTKSTESSTVSDAFGYLGYSLPAVIALLMFPKPQAHWISRYRSVLDAAVIVVGVVLVGEATVLRPVRESVDLSTLTGLTGLAFPIIDLTICAVVLTLGMHRRPGRRLTWLCLGTGLVVQAVTDCIYVILRLNQSADLTGTALVAGWMLAPVLIGLATLVPDGGCDRGWNLALAEQLVPHIPVLAAMIVIGVSPARPDQFLLVEFALLLLLVTVRQVMIVYENLTLTRDLESKVAARTAELVTVASIVTSSSDAIVGISIDNVITAWNPAAEQLYGFRAADVVGRGTDFLYEQEARLLRGLLLSARRGRKLAAYEVDWTRPDGTEVPIAMTVSPVLNEAEVQGISIIGQDITERRQIAATLEQAREEALESSRLKSEFLATMSHEIRTPMNGVIGLTSLLIETDLDGLQRKYAEGVRSAGHSLLDIINDILDFSKLEAGKVVLDEREFDVRRLVEEVGYLLAPAAFSKGLELLVSCPPDTPTTVRGDLVRTRQILLNLASNAVKFTATGEVTVKVEAQHVDQGEVSLRFQVMDTGIGIAEKDQLRLFESFTQADASTTRRFGGTGLGLAICQRLVEAMGGTIGLHSEPGVGSTFWFEIALPLGAVAANPPVCALRDTLPGLRVLVVDDNATNRAILADQLTSWRMRTDLMDNATAALALLRQAAARGEAYDLAVLDLAMPVVDGLWLARAITADPTLTGMPMIMLTSAQRLPTSVLREAGIGQWLTKPVSSSEMYDRLLRLMAPKDAAHEPVRQPAAPVTGPTPSRGRILVAEDNVLNQLVAAGLVSRLGFEVDTVANGEEALAAVEATAYAAVLMDCHMPVMDGYAATREIRRRQGGAKHTPVIALTAGALVSDRERCLAAGMDDYIPKPVDAETLETVLGHWVPDLEHAPSVDPPSVDPPFAAIEARPAWEATDQAPLDWSRIEALRGLQAPDGSSLIASFVSSFTSNSANRLAAISKAVAEAEPGDLALAAHELKGSASTIGAVRVAAICGVLERVGRDRITVPPGLLDELDDALARAAVALADVTSPLAAT